LIVPQFISLEQAEIEFLKRYGWSDEEIASMTPAQRCAESLMAMELMEDDAKQSLAPKLYEKGAPEQVPNPSRSSSVEQPALAADPPAQPCKPLPSASSSNVQAKESTLREPWRFAKWKNSGTRLVYGLVGLLTVYALSNVISWHQRVTSQHQEVTQIVPGWDRISGCLFMASFDGKRHLSLSENHFARIEEPDQADSDGSWAFDESTGKYIVTVDGEAITYSAVAPGDGDNCMLIKGDLRTADLPRSWFYSRADLDDQTDRDSPER
jgi:hypothetical protein